jgi:uncharacterized protein (TIGR03435 family)
MRGYAQALLVALAACFTAGGQESAHPKFDVVSIRPVGPREDASGAFMRGGPGTADPERITWREALVRVLTRAYGVDFDQISGPSWLGTEHYDIVANVPAGTTKEQLRLMWQDLLAERFHLKAHMIQKDFPGYELSVAKNGPKLARSG